MNALLRGATIYQDGVFVRRDIRVSGGVVSALGHDLSPHTGDTVYDFFGLHIFPGFADVHVHLREPGFSYKETIASGTRAAAAGGYTAVCAMPNLNPPPGTAAGLEAQRARIAQSAAVPVLPFACITRDQLGHGPLADYAALAPLCIGFSDDGKGVQDEALMARAMAEIKAVGGILAAHVEDEALLNGGYIHDGAYARAHGHRGICSESEWGQLKRDLALVARTGCRYHMCHVSTRESVALLRRAKADGLPVTAETAPHYLLLCEQDLQDDGRFKMNPPLRTADDRDALVEGLRDGTIDLIATDHAPHAEGEKAGGLRDSAMGVVGLETAFAVLYTGLVLPGALTLETLIDRMALAPRRAFPGLPGGPIEEGARADLCVADLSAGYTIDPSAFLSMGRATPFAGRPVRGTIMMTLVGGEIVWQR